MTAKTPRKPSAKKRRQTKHTRSGAQQEKDLQTTAQLYLAGVRQVDIAAQHGVTQQQISLDIKELQKRWVASSLRDFDEARAEELAKVDELEHTYWEAWRKSIKSKTRKLTERKTGDTQTERAQVNIEERDGDPRFLAGVMDCITKRCKLLGLDAPVKSEVREVSTFADLVLEAAGDIAADGDDPQD